ncbi:MAG: TetR/AcrR family transcriptional regulator [Bacteroidota bacterium]
MVKVKRDETTEERILEAARKVFVRKGMTGARMQEIADEAGINKALLHYYFRNKEMLFDTIFRQAAQKLFPQLNIIFESDMPLFEKIETFVATYIDVMLENPYLPMFVLGEINQDPGKFYKKMNGELKFPKPDKFLVQIDKEVRKGDHKENKPPAVINEPDLGNYFPLYGKAFVPVTYRAG